MLRKSPHRLELVSQKKSFARGLSKIIPIVGAAISGGLTYASFKPMAQKLNLRLQEDMELFRSGYQKAKEAEYEE